MPIQENKPMYELLTLQEIGLRDPIRMLAYCPNMCASPRDIAVLGGEFFTVEAVVSEIPGDAILMMAEVEDLTLVDAVYRPVWVPAARKEADA